MGNRALVVFTDRDETELSPAIYLHWGGSNVGGLLQRCRRIMANRLNDVPYTAARFCGVCHELSPDNDCGLGLLAAPDSLEQVKDKEFSHGNAGVFLVNCGTWQVEAFNGYGFGDGVMKRTFEVQPETAAS